MNAVVTGLLAGCAAALAASGLWLAVARCRAGAWRGEDALRAVLPLVVVLIPVAVLVGAKGHCEDWDAARVCTAVAWVKGFAVYAGLNEGAIQTSMYPPGWLLAYAAAAAGRTPAAVVQIGGLLAVFYFFLPFLCARRLLGLGRAQAWLALAMMTFAATRVESLWWCAFSPHADAPALGFGLLAVLLLQAGARTDARRTGWLAAAAVAAGISVWCKQTMVPLLPALVLWLLAQRQWRQALTLAGLLGAVGAVLAGISLWIAPADALWLNLVTIPGNCDWIGQFPFSLLKALQDLARMGFIAIPLLAAGAVLGACMLPAPAFRDWIRQGAWLPALLVAVLMVPVSLVGIVKVGGALNSFGATHYFLFAAAVLQWVELAAAAGREDGATRRARGALAWGMAACWWAVAGLWLLQSVQELRYGLYDPRQSLCQKAYDYLAHDNRPRAYFPAYPLAHVLAEGRLYHYVHGMGDRDQAGHVPIAPDHLAAHVPSDAAIVCWTARQMGSEHGRGQRYFPAFNRLRPVPALPDFNCFARGAGEAAAP